LESERAIKSAEGSRDLATGTGTRLIVVGGTGEFMARLIPDPRTIDLSAVRKVLSRLGTLSAAELSTEIDIPEARARVLPAGVTIVAAIAEWLNPERIEISQSGIRAGLLLEAFDAVDLVGEPNGVGRGAARDTKKAARGGNEHTSRRQALVQDTNFRETMKALIAERWDAVWRAIPVALEGTDIEGVHDVRVASRRLRAAMDIAAPVFPRGWYRPLHQAAKEITGALGEVRDRDVLLQALQADRDAAPVAEHPGIDRLIARVERERAAARIEMERYLGDLLRGSLPHEIERRFRSTEKSSDQQSAVTGGAK
jgi:hypothetical protein